MGERLLRIGELATQAGVSTRTVDYYTGLGLLAPAGRTEGNFRLYPLDAVERIVTIRRLETHGVGLEDIASALHAPSAGDLVALLGRLDRDLRALRAAAGSAGPESHGLLAAITARAHSLITTALDIAGGGMPPPAESP